MIGNWIFLGLGAAAIAAVICLAAGPLAKALGLSAPAEMAGGDEQSSPPALVGGFAVALPALGAMLLLFNQAHEGFYTGLGLVTIAFLILGYADDRQGLVPAYRLLATLAFSALAIYYAPGLEVSFLRLSFLSQSLFLDQWAPVFTVLAVVGLQNSVCAAGDRKGMMPAIMLFWLALLYYHGTTDLYPLLSAIAGALAVVMVFSYRGSVALGNAGAYSLSVLIGCIAVYAYNQGFLLVTADAVVLMFMVPVLDFTRLAISRVLDGHSPLVAETRNLLDLLSQAFGDVIAPVIYFSCIAIPNILALLFPAATALLLVLVVLVYAVGYTLLSRRAEDHTLA